MGGAVTAFDHVGDRLAVERDGHHAAHAFLAGFFDARRNFVSLSVAPAESAFTVADHMAFSALNLRVIRDDGVVIYLNGTEVYRNNMPSGAPNYQTLAVAAIGGTDESTYYAAFVDPGGLVTGNNVIAAEIHQSGGTSSDISFDFELTGSQSYIAPIISTQPQSQTVGEGSVASLSVLATGTAPLR